MVTKDVCKTVKTNIWSVAGNETVVAVINDAVLRHDMAKKHVSHILKLYCTYCCDNGDPLPIIDQTFVNYAFQALREQPIVTLTDNSTIKERLFHFVQEYYKHIMVSQLDLTDLTQIFQYTSKEMVTSINNHIKANFVTSVECLVNTTFQLKQRIQLLQEQGHSPEVVKYASNEIKKSLRLVKEDLLNITTAYKSDQIFHAWIEHTRSIIQPNQVFDHSNIIYDLKAHPQDYLAAMFYMAREIEKRGVKCINAMPLNTSFIPSHSTTIKTAVWHNTWY